MIKSWTTNNGAGWLIAICAVFTAAVFFSGCRDSTPSDDVDGCVPECGERECGRDPVCGVSCGECDDGYICNTAGECIDEQDFGGFCLESFGAEKDALIYRSFGDELEQPGDWWEYVSEKSASIGFSTNLPAVSYIEYGETPEYGTISSSTDRFYYRHLHTLRNLEPGTMIHYRVVLTDERGNTLSSEGRTLTPEMVTAAVRIPDDMDHNPPFVLDSEGVYVVTEDITTGGKAFEIDAPNVVLDLGGNNITYNDEFQDIDGDWPHYVENAAYGVRAMDYRDNIRIFNGHIRQGAGGNHAHPSASIGFNPIYVRSGAGFEVAGVVIEYHGGQMIGLYMHWGSSDANIHNNVFIDNGREILDRHGAGSRTLIFGGQDVPLESRVYDNLVKRTRQSGLSGGRVYGNEIYVDSYSTNSFGIGGGTGLIVHSNKIFGTGYHMVGIGWGSDNHFFDNFIHLHGGGPDWRYDEYGNQESLNGMRLTQYSGSHREYFDNHYHDNLILITGGKCNGDDCTQGRGIQHSSDANVRNNVIEGNIIKVEVNPEITQVAAIVTQGLRDRCGTEHPVHWIENTLISNVVNVRFGDYYAAGCNHHFVANEFIKIGDREDYRTFRFDANWGIMAHYVFDGVFTDDADIESIHFTHPDQELNVGWTLTVEVLQGGVPAEGAEVCLTDVHGTEFDCGLTDSLGLFSTLVVEYIHRSGGKEYLTPTEVEVSNNGSSSSEVVTVDHPQTITVILD